MKNPPKRVFVVVSYRTGQANSVCYGAAMTSVAQLTAETSIRGMSRDPRRRVLHLVAIGVDVAARAEAV